MSNEQSPATATARMRNRATMPSAEKPASTPGQIASNLIDQFVVTARLRDEPIEHSGEAQVPAARFVLGFGPSIDVTFTFTETGSVDYAVLDYSEGTGRAFQVIADSDAELLYDALQRYYPNTSRSPRRARNLQPGVMDTSLDVEAWAPNPPDAAEEDEQPWAMNTYRAGRALRAVLPESNGIQLVNLAADAVALYTDTPSTHLRYRHDLADVVENLLVDMMHLADARNVDLGATVQDRPGSVLHQRLSTVNNALKAACINRWEPILDRLWEVIVSRALRRYQNDLHATPTRTPAGPA